MILEINIPNHSWIKILYTLLVLGILVCGIYTFRRRLLQSVLRVLRKLNDSEDRDIPEMEKKVENDITRKEVLSLEGISHEVESGTEKKILAHTDDKYRTNKVSPEECKRLYRLLDQEMKRNKPYRNPNLKVAELASLIGTTSHSLSYLFNQYLEKNYYDYINEYRVEEFKALILKEEYAKYTLTALAELCGFSSRASFFRSFKKVTGITPNEYIKQVSGERRSVD